nr:MAG TPA: hypothetical protein [Caudoviricetes sp.]
MSSNLQVASNYDIIHVKEMIICQIRKWQDMLHMG